VIRGIPITVGRSASAVALLLLVACGGGDPAPTQRPVAEPPGPLARVAVTTSVPQIEVTETAIAAAAGFDAQSRPVTIGATVFSSATPDVATVTSSGLIIGLRPGRATIVAAVDGQRGEGTITIVPIPVASVTIAPGSMTLVPGASQEVSATALDRRGLVLQGRPIAWTSSDPLIARVSATGVITAVAGGVATISANADGVISRVVVTVTTTEGRVTRIAVAPTSAAMRVGDRLPFNFALSDSLGRDATGRVFRWSVSDTSIISVSDNGLVIARAPGSAAVRVSSEGMTGTASVTVSPATDFGLRIIVLRPEEGATIIDTSRPVIDVRRASAVNGVTVTINGRPIALRLLPFNAGLNTFFYWQGPIDIQDFPLGRNVALVQTTDAAGRRGQVEFVFLREFREGGGGTRPPTPVK
jgi:hypothetical protein